MYALGQAKEFELTILKLLKKYFSEDEIFTEIMSFMKNPIAFNYHATISSAIWLFTQTEFSQDLVDGVYTFSMIKVLPFKHRKDYMLILQLAA